VISWDIAMKASELADYSVGTVWHVQDRGRKAHLVDLVRGRFEYPELVVAALALWRKWKVEWAPTHLVIEDKGSDVRLIAAILVRILALPANSPSQSTRSYSASRPW
jgi:phage terminase large subunit-like protein